MKVTYKNYREVLPPHLHDAFFSLANRSSVCPIVFVAGVVRYAHSDEWSL